MLKCDNSSLVRYDAAIEKARRWGLRLGATIGVSEWGLIFTLFGAQGISFWYGNEMVKNGEIDLASIFTASVAFVKVY